MLKHFILYFNYFLKFYLWPSLKVVFQVVIIILGIMILYFLNIFIYEYAFLIFSLFYLFLFSFFLLLLTFYYLLFVHLCYAWFYILTDFFGNLYWLEFYFSYTVTACGTHSELINMYSSDTLFCYFCFTCLCVLTFWIPCVYAICWVFLHIINIIIIFSFMDLNHAQKVIEKLNHLFFNSFLEVVGFVIKLFDFIGFTFLNIFESLPENEKPLVCILLLVYILLILLFSKK